MAKKKYSDLSLSPLKSIQEELAKMEKEENEETVPDINMMDLRIGISELSVQISKLAGMNISLQSKMVELMIKISDMVEQITEMVDLLKMASEEEDEEEKSGEEFPKKLDEIISQLKTLNEQASSSFEQSTPLEEPVSIEPSLKQPLPTPETTKYPKPPNIG